MKGDGYDAGMICWYDIYDIQYVGLKTYMKANREIGFGRRLYFRWDDGKLKFIMVEATGNVHGSTKKHRRRKETGWWNASTVQLS